LTKRY